MPQRDKKIKPAKYTKQQLQSMSVEQLEGIDSALSRSIQTSERPSTDKDGGRDCYTPWIGDGYCDSDCNTHQHNWDGGDCCMDEGSQDCYDPCDINNTWMYNLGLSGPCNCGDSNCPGTYGCNPSNPDLNPCCCNGVSVENCNSCDTVDCSGIYNECGGCALLGDANGDGTIDVLDIVQIVNCIINNTECNDCMDINGDGDIDVIDIVVIVNMILGGESRTSATQDEREILTGILHDLKNVQNKSTHKQMSVLRDIQSKLRKTKLIPTRR